MKSRRGEKIKKKKRSISGHELQQHLAGCLKNKEEMLGEMLTQGPGAIHHRHQYAGPTQAHGRARPPPLLHVFPLLEPQNIAQTGNLAPFFSLRTLPNWAQLGQAGGKTHGLGISVEEACSFSPPLRSEGTAAALLLLLAIV